MRLNITFSDTSLRRILLHCTRKTYNSRLLCYVSYRVVISTIASAAVVVVGENVGAARRRVRDRRRSERSPEPRPNLYESASGLRRSEPPAPFAAGGGGGGAERRRG